MLPGRWRAATVAWAKLQVLIKRRSEGEVPNFEKEGSAEELPDYGDGRTVWRCDCQWVQVSVSECKWVSVRVSECQ
jgi:hypothetical protein